MFVLRTFEEQRNKETGVFAQNVSNHFIGDYYAVFRNGISMEFETILKEKYPDCDKNCVNAILVFNDFVKLLMKPTEDTNYTYYIVNINGKTYERL